MDELLALMDGDESPGCPNNAERTGQNDASALDPMEEFASLLMVGSKSSSSPPAETNQTSKKKSTSTATAPAVVATVGVDEKLGIRMINRQMSSLDLLDFITTGSPYHSPAKISAMSLQALCGILVDPPSIVDRATVEGRTYASTVGIVFENSGTKTSSKGGAFTILTIGSNLESGPCLSIFLFGSAYTKYCRTCQAGSVVAVSNPKLLPARNDNKGGGGRFDTRISMSVHDQSQLIFVAKARDYGVCKATVGRKQPDGTWKSNAGTCRNYIDTRMGDYCPQHAKQQRDKEREKNRLAHCSNMRGMGGVSTVPKTKAGNLVQQHKANKVQATVQAPRGNCSIGGENRFLMGNRSVGAGKQNIVTPNNNLSKSTGNRFLNPGAQTAQTNTKVSAPAGRGIASLDTKKKENPSTNNKNPYITRKPNSTSKAPSMTKQKDALPKQTRATTPATGDWMNEAASKRKPIASLNKYLPDGDRSRKISTVGGGFDGSVPVPQPKLFVNQAVKVSTRGNEVSLASKLAQEERERQKIVESQAILAERLRERRAGENRNDAPDNKVGSNQLKGSKMKTCASGNAFLDSIQVDDVEAVLNAKSQFASEADAEDYAKSRQRIVELEQLETKQTKRKDANKRDKENQKIQVEWVCRTCLHAPRFTSRPTECLRNGHEVKKTRIVKEMITKADERTRLNEKGSKDDGFILGRGLEWSKNRFNDNN